MKKEFKLIAIPLIIVAIIAGYFISQKPKEETATEVAPEVQGQLHRSSAYIKGAPDAKVKIVEFFDPECPGCRAFYPVVMKVMEEYKGKVSLEARYMLFHTNSYDAALAMEGAGKQGKYWEYTELLFNKQEDWGNFKEPIRHMFEEYAKELGLDLVTFRGSYEDFSYKSVIAQDMNDGKLLGVQGTPTVFVNGKKLERISYDLLKEAIDSELK